MRTFWMVSTVAAVLALLASARGDLARLTAAPGWEYRVAGVNEGWCDAELNEYGRDGWELVTADRRVDLGGSMYYEVILKRAR